MKRLALLAILTVSLVLPLSGTTFIINSFRYVSSTPFDKEVADANARLSLSAEGVVVSGAGTAEANGTFTQRGIHNDKPYYNLTSNSTSDEGNGAIFWGSGMWHVTNQSGVTVYNSSDDVARPDLVTTWTDAEGNGTLPLPAVTHQAGDVTGAGYLVKQTDNSTIYTFQGDGADADAGLWVTTAGTTDVNGAYLALDASTYSQLNGIHTFTPTGIGSVWVVNSDPLYAGDGPQTYAWQTGAWIQLTGDLPVPTVLRNPIASEANWTQP